MTTTITQTFRVRVSPNGQYDTQTDRFFNQKLNLLQSIEEMLIEYLGVKIIKSEWVYYNTDPYAHAKCAPARSQYVFVDFELLPNNDPMIHCSRSQLFDDGHVLIKLQNQYITVYIQDKSINVLSGAIRTSSYPIEEDNEEKEAEEEKEDLKSIRVRVSPVYYDGLTQTERFFQNYSSVLKLHQQYVEELLIAQFGVKIIKSIDVYYSKDPYAHTDEHSQHMFIDFEWLPNTDQTVADLRHQLLSNNVIIAHKNQHICINIQDKRRNVLMGSTSSILNYYSNGVPITAEFVEKRLDDNEPFTGEDEEPALGYRDAYINFV